MKRTICKLDPNIANGHGMISIRMLKMTGGAITEPFSQFSKIA